MALGQTNHGFGRQPASGLSTGSTGSINHGLGRTPVKRRVGASKAPKVRGIGNAAMQKAFNDLAEYVDYVTPKLKVGDKQAPDGRILAGGTAAAAMTKDDPWAPKVSMTEEAQFTVSEVGSVADVDGGSDTIDNRTASFEPVADNFLHLEYDTTFDTFNFVVNDSVTPYTTDSGVVVQARIPLWQFKDVTTPEAAQEFSIYGGVTVTSNNTSYKAIHLTKFSLRIMDGVYNGMQAPYFFAYPTFT